MTADRRAPWLVAGPSRMEMFRACPRRYHLRYALRLPADPPAQWSGLGLAVHDALRAQHGTDGTHQDEGGHGSRFETDVWRMVRRHQQVCPGERASYVGGEVDVWWLWRRERVLLHGRLDAVWRHPDGAIEVRDYKTGGAPAPPDRDPAMGLYGLLAAATWPEAPVVRLTVEALAGDEPTAPSVEADRALLATAAASVSAWVGEVRAQEELGPGGFAATPSPTTCAGCEFSYCCPASQAG